MKELVIHDRLEKEGFSKLPKFVVEPNNPDADMVVFVTGCKMLEFKEGINHLTKTKFIYPYSNKKYIANSSAAAAIELLDKGIRTVVHVDKSDVELVTSLLKMHPNSNRAYIVSGNLGSIEFIKNFYDKICLLIDEKPISKIFLLPYNSFASNAPHPFTPFGVDDMSVISEILDKRVGLFYFMTLLAYDLLLNKGQEEMRIATLTSLAAKRASSHLLTDTLHKAISNVFLETIAFEMPHYTGKKVYVIEIAPGIVDTGLYDSEKTREYVFNEAKMDGFPFGREVVIDGIENFPMMSAFDVAKIAIRYLITDENADINVGLDESLKQYLTAGRDYKSLEKSIRESLHLTGSSIKLNKLLPSYVYTPNSEYGMLPQLKIGYTPVMLCPLGQLF